MALYQHQLQNLQQQMQEYNPIVMQQQKLIIQLLQKEQQYINEFNLQWPSLREARSRLFQRKKSNSKHSIYNNNAENECPPTRSRQNSKKQKKKTPRNVHLGDFMPAINRQQSRIS